MLASNFKNADPKFATPPADENNTVASEKSTCVPFLYFIRSDPPSSPMFILPVKSIVVASTDKLLLTVIALLKVLAPAIVCAPEVLTTVLSTDIDLFAVRFPIVVVIPLPPDKVIALRVLSSPSLETIAPLRLSNTPNIVADLCA